MTRRMPTPSPSLRPTARPFARGSIASVVGAAVALSCAAPPPALPTTEAQLAPAQPSPDPPPAVPDLGGSDGGPPVSNADRVVAGLRGRFHVCYTQGASHPEVKGRVLFSVTLTSAGLVDSIEPAQVEGLGENVVACLARVIRSASFSAPGGKGATLQVPLSFEPAAR